MEHGPSSNGMHAAPEDSPEERASRAFARFLDAFDSDPHADAAAFCPDDPIAARSYREAHAGWLSLVAEVPEAGAPPVEIDGYRVVRELGRGGMGVVLEAEQDAPRRVVAVKVVRGAGAASPAQLHLFQREIAVLARLHHPHVATIFGAGRARDGQPYFAMERVQGVPLNRWARERASDRDAVLAAFDQVCDAVCFAHRRGVIHRDLKPSNILVDGEGRVKVLDFGLARLLDAEEGDAAASRTLSLRGTLAYMSPEQAGGRLDAVDTRSDVYALGAVLYELLCGRPPHALEGRSTLEALRAIREDDVARPRALRPDLPLDLETVVIHALEKDPERRYATAEAMREDVRRFRRGEPILARPPSRRARLVRLIRRHRAWFLGGAVLIAMGVVLTASLVQQNRALVQANVRIECARDDAEQARRRAETEKQRSAQVTAFLSHLLTSVSPRRGGRDVTVRELLDAASADLDEAWPGRDPPHLEAPLRATLGRAWHSLGFLDRAEPDLRRAVALYEAEGMESRRELRAARRSLALLLGSKGRMAEAVPLLEAVLADARGDVAFGEASLAELTWQYAQFLYDVGRYQEADAQLASLLPVLRRLFPDPMDPRTLEIELSRCHTLLALGRRDEAVAVYDRVAAWFRNQPVLSPEQLAAVDLAQRVDLRAIADLGQPLAEIALTLDRPEDAGQWIQPALAYTLEAAGEEHTYTATVLHTVARIHARLGRIEEARTALARAIEIRRRLLGADHPDTRALELELDAMGDRSSPSDRGG